MTRPVPRGQFMAEVRFKPGNFLIQRSGAQPLHCCSSSVCGVAITVCGRLSMYPKPSVFASATPVAKEASWFAFLAMGKKLPSKLRCCLDSLAVFACLLFVHMNI